MNMTECLQICSMEYHEANPEATHERVVVFSVVNSILALAQIMNKDLHMPGIADGLIEISTWALDQLDVPK
jgi:hypothetical protein